VKKVADFCGPAMEYHGCRPQISDWWTEIPRRQRKFCIQDRKKLGSIIGMLWLVTGMLWLERVMSRSDLRRPRFGKGKCHLYTILYPYYTNNSCFVFFDTDIKSFINW
jgi:hypothetical protein